VEAANILGANITPDFVLTQAMELGMTKCGEMFSTDAMQRLAEMYVGAEGRILNTTEKSTFTELVKHSLKGYPSLIP
jgi:hypothetical protein